MTEFDFKTLASIGFNHPLHPVVAHLGMVMGMFFWWRTGVRITQVKK